MDPKKAVEMVDENTICVAAILGSTLTGEFEDVKLLNDLLTEKNKRTGFAFLVSLSLSPPPSSSSSTIFFLLL
jgi:glutamate/tyrosine decarboxylase-like PLP-dependent enzyme